MSSLSSVSPLNWRLLAGCLAPYRRQLLILAGALATTIAVRLLMPLAAARFIDAAVDGRAMGTLVPLALLAMAFALVGQVVAIAETWVAERVAWGATNSLREDLVAHLLHLDLAFHNARTPGELIERVDGDVGTLARIFSRFTVYVIGNGLLVIGVVALLVAVDWRIGLALSVFAATAVAAMLRLRAVATPHSAAERQAAADVYGLLGEYVVGLEDIRSSDARAFALRRFAERMRRWLAARLHAQMYGYGIVASSHGLFGLGTAFAFAIAAALYRDGGLTIGAVYLVVRYTDMLRQPIEQIRNEVQDLQHAAASLGRVERLLSERSVLHDGGLRELPAGRLGIAFDRVSFAYELDAPVLRQVSLSIAPGRVLGVVGRTGSGKSTLARMVPRFVDPDAGAVRLGEIDLRDATLAAVRSRVGLLSQESQLFGASVRDNATLFDDAVADERIVDALVSVGMGDWLAGLSAGLDTPLGTDDGGLSAGQAQLLACARLLLRDPDVVLLDEPSSKLDPVTERRVHRALARLLAGRTGIVIAHRLSTLSLVDDIVVLEAGRIVEQGTRARLAVDPATRYAAMLRSADAEVLS